MTSGGNRNPANPETGGWMDRMRRRRFTPTASFTHGRGTNPNGSRQVRAQCNSAFANQLARAAIPNDVLTARPVAADGTDVETWGALHGEATMVDLDGEATDTQLSDFGPQSRTQRPVRRAKILGVGPDGRKRYTVDPDARAGHRSATNSRSAGPYVGYELHLAVQARDVRWTNHIDRTTLEPEVPGVVTTCNLVPGGTHRGKAVVDRLIASRGPSTPLEDVVWDPV